MWSSTRIESVETNQDKVSCTKTTFENALLPAEMPGKWRRLGEIKGDTADEQSHCDGGVVYSSDC
jgi:hypothetical protein